MTLMAVGTQCIHSFTLALENASEPIHISKFFLKKFSYMCFDDITTSY